MHRKVIYIAEDGTRFDSRDDCLSYEVILNKCISIMSLLYYNKEALDEGKAIRHSKTKVKVIFDSFIDLCSKAIPQSNKELQEVKEGRRHISHAEYIISEYQNDFPCLSKAMYRFMCIDKCGIEYPQPYYAKHPAEFKGEFILYNVYCGEAAEAEDK